MEAVFDRDSVRTSLLDRAETALSDYCGQARAAVVQYTGYMHQSTI